MTGVVKIRKASRVKAKRITAELTRASANTKQ
jgi:hypothetical protein